MTTPENYRRLQRLIVGVGIVVVGTLVAVLLFALHEANVRDADRREAQANLQAQIRRNDKTRIALCGLRLDLEKRIEADRHELRSSQLFLLAHPNGIPGIPAALIRESIQNRKTLIRNERGTRKILDILDC